MFQLMYRIFYNNCIMMQARTAQASYELSCVSRFRSTGYTATERIRDGAIGVSADAWMNHDVNSSSIDRCKV